MTSQPPPPPRPQHPDQYAPNVRPTQAPAPAPPQHTGQPDAGAPQHTGQHQYPAYPQQHAGPAQYPVYPQQPQAKPPALPAEPVEYQHLLRGPRRRWWRPIASFGLVLAGVIIASIALMVLLVLAYFLTADGASSFESLAEDFNNPITLGAQNLWLAALIPIAGLATWIAHGVRPGFVSSVAGTFRWGWFAWCFVVVLPIWLAYIAVASAVSYAVDGGGNPLEATGRPANWVILVILTLLTTPLQAAGEEYLFRGWLMQQIGMYVRNTSVALTIAVLISATVFALAHTSLDPWILIDLAAFATAAVLLTWRTGGLEAAVALHVINNLIVIILMIMTQGLENAFITTDTTSDPLTAGMSLTSLAVVTAALWWLADKRGVARRSAGTQAGSQSREVAPSAA